MINVSIDIKETDQQIERKITEAVRDQLNKSFPKMVTNIDKIVKKAVFDSIIAQPEYDELRSGTLAIELGLRDGASRMLSIIDIWLRNIEVTFKKFRAGASGLTGGIIVNVAKSDYSDVLDSHDSILLTEKSELLPWLKWLLLFGDSTIIANYSVSFGPHGRTGGGIMVNRGSWGIPSEFSGSSNNNFITRALDSIQDDLEKQITNIIERQI